MSIHGLGIQSTVLQVPRAVDSSEKLSRAENQAAVASTGNITQNNDSKAVRFAPVAYTDNATGSTTPRQNPAEIEGFRNSFRIQQELNKPQGESGRAVQSFLDIANFERKDELMSMVGLDIFI